MLIAYFRNSPVEKCMDIEVPLHTVIKFTPARGGGWSESVHPLAPVNNETELPPPPPLAKEEKSSSKSNIFFWPFFKNSNEDDGQAQKHPSGNGLDQRTHRGMQF